MLFLREYNIEVGCNTLEPSGSLAAASSNAIPTREYNRQVSAAKG